MITIDDSGTLNIYILLSVFNVIKTTSDINMFQADPHENQLYVFATALNNGGWKSNWPVPGLLRNSHVEIHVS